MRTYPCPDNIIKMLGASEQDNVGLNELVILSLYKVQLDKGAGSLQDIMKAGLLLDERKMRSAVAQVLEKHPMVKESDGLYSFASNKDAGGLIVLLHPNPHGDMTFVCDTSRFENVIYTPVVFCETKQFEEKEKPVERRLKRDKQGEIIWKDKDNDVPEYESFVPSTNDDMIFKSREYMNWINRGFCHEHRFVPMSKVLNTTLDASKSVIYHAYSVSFESVSDLVEFVYANFGAIDSEPLESYFSGVKGVFGMNNESPYYMVLE